MAYLILKLKPTARLSVGFLNATLNKAHREGNRPAAFSKVYDQFFTDWERRIDFQTDNYKPIIDPLHPDQEQTLAKFITTTGAKFSFLFNGSPLTEILDFQGKNSLISTINLLNFFRLRFPNGYLPPEETIRQLRHTTGVAAVCVVPDVVSRHHKPRKKRITPPPCTPPMLMPLPATLNNGLQSYQAELAMQNAWSRLPAQGFPGRGAGVKLAIVDHSWQPNFGEAYCIDDLDHNYPNWRKTTPGYTHGTHTLGVLLSRFQPVYPPTYIPVGLVPNANVFLSSSNIGGDDVYGDVESAIFNAVNAVNKSASKGVVLIVLGGPGSTGAVGSAPIETKPKPASLTNCAVVELVGMATDFGIMVIESAGNGGVELTTPLPDSGAVIVGATATTGVAHTRSRYGTSDFGERIDIAVWGDGIKTVGGMGLFSETSVASTIVAGIVTSLLSIAQVQYNRLIPPAVVRMWLRGVNNFAPPQPDSLAVYTMPSMDALLAQLDAYCAIPPTP